MKLSLNLKELKKLLPMLRGVQPVLAGLVLIGVFAYTSTIVNSALNVQAKAAAKSKSGAKITFDKATIDAVKKLDVVNGTVPVGDLGQDDPFR